MKRLWLAGGIFAVIISLCIVTLQFQRKQVKTLIFDLDMIDAAFAEKDNERAYALSLALIDEFERRTYLFPCFMSHNDLIGCRESVAILPSILKDGDAEEFHMESARCRAQFERLLDVETPNLQNIF